MKYKITLREFWNSPNKLAIHCNTGLKAFILLKAFNAYGMCWDNNVKYTLESNYKVHGKTTGYTNCNTYCHIDFLKEYGYTIYEFEDVDLQDFQYVEETITLKEFWKAQDKLAIYCATEKQANKLLKAFDKFGKRWKSGDLYTSKNNYSIEKETCYTNKNEWIERADCETEDVNLYDYSQILFDETKENDKNEQ